MSEMATEKKKAISKEDFVIEVLNDYRLAYESRQASLTGRKEVLTGKAKFGIFGDGKEVAQIAMAKAFQKGDFRSGYYRDQTFMFALKASNIREFFAQLYATPDVSAEPASAGRSMNGHFATRLLDEEGQWLSQTDRYNSSADISPTAGQMPRLLGLAWASKLYRNNSGLSEFKDFSIHGNEVAFGTIGNASTSEGGFWETINAAGVLQVPLCMSIWDDDYGISVPAKYQTTKENLSSILSGFQSDKDGKGYELFKVKGWDYPNLIKTYAKAVKLCRENHIPVIIHVTEITQPQGHSTSGSHERYKSKERLEWEQEHDCINKMREWILDTGLSDEDQLVAIEKEAAQKVKDERKEAWKEYRSGIDAELKELMPLLTNLAQESGRAEQLNALINSLENALDPIRKDIVSAAKSAIRLTIGENNSARLSLKEWLNGYINLNEERYDSHLYSQSSGSLENIIPVDPEFSESSPLINGFEVLQQFFDLALQRDPRVVAFGEDVGKIGDVNQGFAGLQEKHGEIRVTDTGIRELTIIGQAIGAAMRGLRPIAEIQYLDYLLYALQIMSDDIATLQYRTKGGQKAPLIIRTRGHRLEGIWHSGSPMGMIIHAVRGMHVLVPRNMVQAAGFYNALLQCDEPALLIECLNGYRLKEKLPDNLNDFTLKPGIPEVLQEGTDVTLVTYGSCVRIAEEGMALLQEKGISVELIDVQSLIPFDTDHRIVESLKKTNKIVFMDEDVPGGATAYMMQKVLEEQKGYFYLDSEPRTISSKEHRPAYGTDGDYFSKSNADDVFETIYGLMHEYAPEQYPEL
jgi:2-oxoisovalerate dehydrogenase E1 component